MTVVPLEQYELIYLVMAIDENAHDHVLAVCRSFSDARQYCTSCLCSSEYFDVWIEKHPLQ